MKPEQVKEIVKITLDELIRRKYIEVTPYPYILQIVEKKLKDFFIYKKDGTGLNIVLYQLIDDPYIDVIYLQYRDKKTLEWIAEAMEKDISTIKRNKKRLILKMYEILEAMNNERI